MKLAIFYFCSRSLIILESFRFTEQLIVQSYRTPHIQVHLSLTSSVRINVSVNEPVLIHYFKLKLMLYFLQCPFSVPGLCSLPQIGLHSKF